MIGSLEKSGNNPFSVSLDLLRQCFRRAPASPRNSQTAAVYSCVIRLKDLSCFT